MTTAIYCGHLGNAAKCLHPPNQKRKGGSQKPKTTLNGTLRAQRHVTGDIKQLTVGRGVLSCIIRQRYGPT